MKKISTVRAFLLTSFLVSPIAVFAQNTLGQTATAMGQNVQTGIVSLSVLVDVVSQILVKSLVTLALSTALLVFFYGIVQYIWGKQQGETSKIKVGNDFMKWGLVALFVMFSVYGIIRLFQGILFNGKDFTTIDIPNITFRTGSASDVRVGGGTTGGITPGAGTGGAATGGVGGATTGGAVGGSNGQNTGTVTKKPNAYSCTLDSECQSGFCDPVGDTCTSPSQAYLRPNAYSCTSSSQCESGFCDPADNTCSPVVSGGGLGEGIACADTAQCAAGLTCSGNNASNRVCTGTSNQSSGSSGGGLGDSCTFGDINSCSGALICDTNTATCVNP